MRSAMSLWAIGVVLMMATAAAAQQPGERGGRAGDGERGRGGEGSRDGERERGFRPPPSPVIEALDLDKDGVVSSEEIQGAVAALKKLDKNNDGKLTRDEFAPSRRPAFGRRGGPGGPGEGQRGRGPFGNPEEFVKRFMEQDKNNDGKVSKDELPEERQRMLQFADTNGDDAIDKSEVEAMAKRFAERAGRPRAGGREPEAKPEGGRGDRPRSE